MDRALKLCDMISKKLDVYMTVSDTGIGSSVDDFKSLKCTQSFAADNYSGESSRHIIEILGRNWKGRFALGKGGFLVSWKEVCKAKAEGGLGLKNLSIMNEAMRLNQLWEMRNEVDSVWKAWTRAYWTKGRDWWEVENASKTTWIIKDLEVCKTLSEKCITFHQNRIHWMGTGIGFTVSHTYNTLTRHTENTDWHKLVWNRFNSPRSSFHLWLVAKNKLLTRDRLNNMGSMVDSSCVLCGRIAESRDHLFFHCQFSKEVVEATAQFLKVRGMPAIWHLLIPWFNALNANALRTRMMAAAISMAAYEIWIARNSKIFKDEAPSVPKTLKKFFGYLRMKIGALNITNITFEDRRWIDSVGRCEDLLKVGTGMVYCIEGQRNAGLLVEVVIIISDSNDLSSPCFRDFGANTEVVLFYDFSPSLLTQMSLKVLTKLDWKSYGLTLGNVLDIDGHVLFEWENLQPNVHIDIALHCHQSLYPLVYHAMMPSPTKASQFDHVKHLKKALRHALENIKEQHSGILLSANALKVCSYSPDLSKTIAGLILSSDDADFQGECMKLLGLHSQDQTNEKESVEACLNEKIIKAISLNDKKSCRGKEPAPLLFEDEVEADNYPDEDNCPRQLKHLPAQKAHGNKWSVIARLFSRRTDNAVKNHFHIIMNRKRKDPALYKPSFAPTLDKSYSLTRSSGYGYNVVAPGGSNDMINEPNFPKYARNKMSPGTGAPYSFNFGSTDEPILVSTASVVPSVSAASAAALGNFNAASAVALGKFDAAVGAFGCSSFRLGTVKVEEADNVMNGDVSPPFIDFLGVGSTYEANHEP
ncbi:unnamed protein product [Rhodiola kirilowii]